VANDGSTYNLTPLLDSTQLTRPIDPLSPYWYKFAVCGGINVGCGVGYCNFDYTAGLCQSWANFTNTASEACCGQAAVANVTGFDGGTGVSIYYTAGDLDRTTEIIVNCNALPGFGTIALNDSDRGNFFFSIAIGSSAGCAVNVPVGIPSAAPTSLPTSSTPPPTSLPTASITPPPTSIPTTSITPPPTSIPTTSAPPPSSAPLTPAPPTPPSTVPNGPTLLPPSPLEPSSPSDYKFELWHILVVVIPVGLFVLCLIGAIIAMVAYARKREKDSSRTDKSYLLQKKSPPEPGPTSNRPANAKPIYKFLSNIGLIEYYDLFIQHGYEQLKIVREMDDTDLQTIGIEKLGHRKAILSAIDRISKRSKQKQELVQSGL